MAIALSYLSYADFEKSVSALNPEYIWNLLQGSVVSRSATQEYVEDQILRPAHSIVNGFISRQRSVPVDSSSNYIPMIKDWVLYIAWYELEKRGHGSTVREKLRANYDDTMRMLGLVGSGKFPILDDDGIGPDLDAGGSIDFVGDEPDADYDNLVQVY